MLKLQRKGVRVRALENAPRLDDESKCFVEAADDLMGPEAISFRDIVAWCEIHGITEVSDYVKFVRVFDRAYRKKVRSASGNA